MSSEEGEKKCCVVRYAQIDELKIHRWEVIHSLLNISSSQQNIARSHGLPEYIISLVNMYWVPAFPGMFF